MAEQLDVAIVGAGPFGLSVAAHLRTKAVRVFGKEMATWRDCMPHGMLLRSAWAETSLSAPDRAGTIDEWVRTTDEERQEPIPLELFLRYASWFAEQFVGDRDPNNVTAVEANGTGYRVTTSAGAEVDARRLVIAVGVMPFAYIPPAVAGLFGDDVAFASTQPHDLQRYSGRRILVIGGGQAGLESAGLAAQAGGETELITRSQVHWFADREPETPRGPIARRIYRIAYPAVGYGPPPLNRLVLRPDLFASLPAAIKARLTKRLLRPGGSPWLKPLIDGKVKVTEHCTVADVKRDDAGLVVELSDGSRREVDEVIVACGYRFDLDRLRFLAPDLQARIAIRGGWPQLDRFFRSSDERIIFVGYPAEGRFGPISRFVLGTRFTANRVEQIIP